MRGDPLVHSGVDLVVEHLVDPHRQVFLPHPDPISLVFSQRGERRLQAGPP
jgi:hypothetical protein